MAQVLRIHPSFGVVLRLDQEEFREKGQSDPSPRSKAESNTPASDIPAEVTQEVIDWTLSLSDEDIYQVTERPDFHYLPPKGSFNKSLCVVCGETVFERYVRLKDGKPHCIPCSGY